MAWSQLALAPRDDQDDLAHAREVRVIAPVSGDRLSWATRTLAGL
jgi:hypothetical protein